MVLDLWRSADLELKHADRDQHGHSLLWTSLPEASPRELIGNFTTIEHGASGYIGPGLDGKCVLELAKQGLDFPSFPFLHTACVYHNTHFVRTMMHFLSQSGTFVRCMSESESADDRGRQPRVVLEPGGEYLRMALFSSFASMACLRPPPGFFGCGHSIRYYYEHFGEMQTIRTRRKTSTGLAWTLVEQEIRRADTDPELLEALLVTMTGCTPPAPRAFVKRHCTWFTSVHSELYGDYVNTAVWNPPSLQV